MRSMQAWPTAALALAGALCVMPAQAADPIARSYAATCANCHGTNGHAQGAMVALAGLPKAHILTQLKAFKDGTRPATIMHQLAKGYTEEQLDLIATYFAAQKR